MTNPFEEILQEIKAVNDRLSLLEKKTSPGPTRIPFQDFCKQHEITRPTAYAWHERGLIRLEKIGGRQFVVSDSIVVNEKYQRAESVAQ